MDFKCPHCGSQLTGESSLSGREVVCGICGEKFVVPIIVAGTDANESDLFPVFEIQKLHGFRLGKFFASVFRTHRREEAEEIFACGTESTTPSIEKVKTAWPTPWLFSRIFLFGILLMLILGFFIIKYGSDGGPGIVGAGALWTIIGSTLIPIVTLILFFECNILRNISSYVVIKWFFMGGCISMFLTFVIHGLPGFSDLTSSGILGASITGLTEEPAKLLTSAFLAGSALKYRHRLNGLLVGASVGAGVAAFETLGWVCLVAVQFPEEVLSVLLLRGLLAPFMHILWTAISTWALWRVKGESKFQLSMLSDKKFLKVFICSIVLHMMWNTEWAANHGLWIYGAIGLAGWFFVFLMMQDGIAEIRSLQTKEK